MLIKNGSLQHFYSVISCISSKRKRWILWPKFRDYIRHDSRVIQTSEIKNTIVQFVDDKVLLFIFVTGLMAELIPHLALFISLVGAFVSTALALLFPPLIELLCYYARGRLNWKVWTINISILLFALFGCITGRQFFLSLNNI